MKKIIFFIGILAFFLASCTQNKIPEFGHYGVYLKTADGFVEINKNNETTIPEIDFENEVELYVFDPQAKSQKYVLTNLRHKYEFAISPVDGNSEIVRILPGHLWGRFFLANEETKEFYQFIVNDSEIATKLKNWMFKIINFYENKDYGNFFESAFPIEIKNGGINEITREMEEDPDGFEDWIDLVKTHVDKIENGEVTFFIESSAIELDKYGFYMYSGDGNWQWFAR